MPLSGLIVRVMDEKISRIFVGLGYGSKPWRLVLVFPILVSLKTARTYNSNITWKKCTIPMYDFVPCRYLSNLS